MRDSGQAITEYALLMVALTLTMAVAFTVKFEGLDNLCGAGVDCPIGIALINALSTYATSYDFVLSMPFP